VVFAALADPTRRHLLEEISERGPTSATDLAAGLPISRQAVVKHLGALGGAGLVRSHRRGREVLFAVEADQLGVATEWLDRIGRVWDERLAALVKHLSTT
jgi:DNA-binding transcriptional ArsR family regulator